MTREELYYDWLVGIVDDPELHETSRLFDILHSRAFYSLVPFDTNRAADGIALREKSGTGYISTQVCSFLEFVVGVSVRCNDIMSDYNQNDIRRWFWELMENCGLEDYTDLNWGDESETDVNDIVSSIVDRTYDYDGNGGLFPLRNPQKDQRNEEIWYQMNAYLVENYYDDYI